MINWILLILIGIAFWACDDVFEKDLQRERVVLLSPADSAQSSQLKQTFYWEALEGARTYRFQIASGSFSAPTGFYFDTIIVSHKLELTLSGGYYNWRVQGNNAGYSTPFTTRSLVIDQ